MTLMGRGSIATHYRIVIKDLVHDARRKGYGRFVVLAADGDVDVPGAAPDASDALTDAEDVARLYSDGARVLDRLRLTGDELAPLVFALLSEGVERRADLAARLGRTPLEITRALERITYHARQVRAEAEQSDRTRRGPPLGSKKKPPA